MKLTLERIIYYNVLIFLLLFPYYSAIRVNNIPVGLFILGIIIFLLVIKFFIKGTFILPRILTTLFPFVLLYVFLGSLIYKPLSSITFKDFLPLLSLVFPFIILNGLDYPRIFSAIKVLIFSTFSLSILIILEYINIFDISFINIHKEQNGFSGRLLGFGDDPNANSFGILFFFNVVLIFYLFFRKKINKKKLHIFIFFVIFLSFLLMLFVSQGRSVLYGAIISVILYHILFLKPLRFSQIKNFLFIFLVLILVIFLFFNYSSIFKRLSYSYSSHRLERWVSGFDIFLKNPIIGVGRDNIKKETFESLRKDPEFPKREIVPGPMNVHNFYIEVLYTTGIIGFIFLIILVGKLLFLVLNIDKLDNEVSKIFFIGIVTFFIFNFFHSMFFIYIFWIYIGFAEAEYYNLKRSA